MSSEGLIDDPVSTYEKSMFQEKPGEAGG